MSKKLLETQTALLAEMRKANDAWEADGGQASEAAQLAAAKAILANTRTPSKARELGDGGGRKARPLAAGYFDSDGWHEPDEVTGKGPKAHKVLKASVYAGHREYAPGSFIAAIAAARSSDAEEQTLGKAALRGLGMRFADTPETSSNKATLGATGATGGYVLPNNLVDTVQKPKTQEAYFTVGDRALLTVRNGVAVRGVDMPYRTGAPARMTFADWGQTKENLDEAYGSYSAILGTMARIYDVGKQYLRFSAGSAEQDVMDELVRAAQLGENFYVLAGAGTGTVGSGDPTTGFYTALQAGPATYRTAFAGANSGTILGNFAVAVAQGIAAMQKRSRTPSAIVTDPATYWTAAVQGSDAAGFFAGGAAMAGATGIAGVQWVDGTLQFWGIPLYFDANFDVNSGTSKCALMADFKAFKFYRGSEFRIDSSDTAGERWDRNLVGFRGEQEIGFHAGPGVAVGAAQWLSAVIP